MTKRIDAVIFDCDGTLVDSETHSLKVLIDYVAEFGLHISHAEAMQRFAGHELSVVFAEFESRLGHKLPDSFLDEFRQRQLHVLAQKVTAIPFAEQLIQSLSVPFCVASNAPLNKMSLVLTTSGLEKHFPDNRRFSAYEVDAWKPDPAVFLHSAQQLNVPPEHCAVIEDSRFGIDAGLAAGMTVFAFDPEQTLTDRHNVESIPCLSALIGRF